MLIVRHHCAHCQTPLCTMSNNTHRSTKAQGQNVYARLKEGRVHTHIHTYRHAGTHTHTHTHTYTHAHTHTHIQTYTHTLTQASDSAMSMYRLRNKMMRVNMWLCRSRIPKGLEQEIIAHYHGPWMVCVCVCLNVWG